mgnify:CR=1 FL=1
MQSMLQNGNQNHAQQLRKKLIKALRKCIECPLTLQTMNIPVIDPTSGLTCEKEAIETWLQRNPTSPFTRETLTIQELIPNRSFGRLLGILKRYYIPRILFPDPTPLRNNTTTYNDEKNRNDSGRDMKVEAATEIKEIKENTESDIMWFYTSSYCPFHSSHESIRVDADSILADAANYMTSSTSDRDNTSLHVARLLGRDDESRGSCLFIGYNLLAKTLMPTNSNRVADFMYSRFHAIFFFPSLGFSLSIPKKLCDSSPQLAMMISSHSFDFCYQNTLGGGSSSIVPNFYQGSRIVISNIHPSLILFNNIPTNIPERSLHHYLLRTQYYRDLFKTD